MNKSERGSGESQVNKCLLQKCLLKCVNTKHLDLALSSADTSIKVTVLTIFTFHIYVELVHVGWRERVILTQGIMGSGHMGTAPVNRQTRLKTLPSHKLRMWAIINEMISL